MQKFSIVYTVLPTQRWNESSSEKYFPLSLAQSRDGVGVSKPHSLRLHQVPQTPSLKAANWEEAMQKVSPQ